ncbi:unnamed protein product [Miscanthus lutarioriparius]|uniref:peptidyl-tRNA hydrolase n=1 Tax=Miscanthus lutarioriparius TaxID=422564 RepID=A0A811PYN8_9POAL|nr:unnamed protein product [Miscanthus lutarioriparius]
MKNVVSTSDVRSARIWPLASAATFGGKNLAVGKKGRVRDGSTSAKQSQIAARIQGSVLHRAAGSLPLLSIAPQLQQSRGESTLFNTPRGDDERSCSEALSPVCGLEGGIAVSCGGTNGISGAAPVSWPLVRYLQFQWQVLVVRNDLKISKGKIAAQLQESGASTTFFARRQQHGGRREATGEKESMTELRQRPLRDM